MQGAVLRPESKGSVDPDVGGDDLALLVDISQVVEGFVVHCLKDFGLFLNLILVKQFPSFLK